MSAASTNGGFVKEMSRWYLCVVLAMGAQILLMFWGSILGPSNGLDRIMDSGCAATSTSYPAFFIRSCENSVHSATRLSCVGRYFSISSL